MNCIDWQTAKSGIDLGLETKFMANTLPLFIYLFTTDLKDIDRQNEGFAGPEIATKMFGGNGTWTRTLQCKFFAYGAFRGKRSEKEGSGGDGWFRPNCEVFGG